MRLKIRRRGDKEYHFLKFKSKEREGKKALLQLSIPSAARFLHNPEHTNLERVNTH